MYLIDWPSNSIFRGWQQIDLLNQARPIQVGRGVSLLCSVGQLRLGNLELFLVPPSSDISSGSPLRLSAPVP